MEGSFESGRGARGVPVCLLACSPRDDSAQGICHSLVQVAMSSVSSTKGVAGLSVDQVVALVAEVTGSKDYEAALRKNAVDGDALLCTILQLIILLILLRCEA